jgi:DNA-binding NarL/FixJ family response regulator
VTLTLLDRPGGTGPADAGGPDAGQREDAPPAPVAAAQPGDTSRPPSRVLVVDDTSVIRREIRALLEDAGLTVVGEAAHGAEGVALARELRPDVVVMDIRMPILDGIAATSHITQDLPGTRVIMFSAFDDQDLRDLARAAGASRFLSKSSPPWAITDAVRDAASGDG